MVCVPAAAPVAATRAGSLACRPSLSPGSSPVVISGAPGRARDSSPALPSLTVGLLWKGTGHHLHQRLRSHLRGVTCRPSVPGHTSGVCSVVTQSPGARGAAVDDSGIPVLLKRIQGTSVLFHVVRNPELPPEVELEKMSWGIVSRSNYRVMLRVFPGRDVPRWVSFQDKFEKRIHVLNTTTLRIDKLTLEDSGLYRARVSLTGGIEYDEDFHLTVYEPVPPPRIRATDLSLTPGWCNVTVECNTTGTRKDVTVSWESKGLPKELEQRPASGPAPNPWTLALNLPLSQPSRLTCVVSNQGNQKTASLDLGDVCGHDLHGPSLVVLLRDILGTIVVTLMILEAGLYLWMRRGKKKLESRKGAGSQEEPRDPDGGIHYADQTYQGSGDRRDKRRGEPHLEEENSLTVVYSEVCRPVQARP
ncbi:SLAM family member 9-like isoform X2 [Meles meles]|uniref:SLAM family member 9-like isoform X2 n=1 Tax=Meles meles TaxID=9662 RepID=UPI001E69A7C1|nr:SLAM family member 9-like isoform X2 [Meles meles]